MAKFCGKCGAPLGDALKFCMSCGTPVQAAQPPAPVQQAYQQPQYQQPYTAPPPPAPKKKSKAPLIAGGVAGAGALVLIVVLIATNVFGLFGKGQPANGGGGDWGKGALELYPAYAELPSGSSVYLDWSTNKELVWSSSFPEVATVDADGLITAIAEGETYITASLKSDPKVTASCGIAVVLYDESGYSANDILIWEDAPPSDFYKYVRYGIDVPESAGEYEGEAGYNIPIILPLDGDGEIAEQVAYNGAGVNVMPLTYTGGGNMQPLKNSAPKGKKIKRNDIKKKLKQDVVWTIAVLQTIKVRSDVRDSESDGTRKLGMLVWKKGGDSPVGKYKGWAQYEGFDTYARHYAKYPDHSKCKMCGQAWYEYWGGNETHHTGCPGPGGSSPDGMIVMDEWSLSKTTTWFGEYTNKKLGGALLEIRELDKSPPLTRPKPNEGPDDDFDPVGAGSGKTLPAKVYPYEWFSISVDLTRSGTKFYDVPTNLGDNWGKTENDEVAGRLHIKIYTDNTVVVNSQYHGTIARALEYRNVPPPPEPDDDFGPVGAHKDNAPDTPPIDAPNYGLPSFSGDEWPTAYLPKDMPKYTDGSISASGESGDVYILIKGTSNAAAKQYFEKLKSAGWVFRTELDFVGEAHKDSWKLEYTWMDKDFILYLTY